MLCLLLSSSMLSSEYKIYISDKKTNLLIDGVFQKGLTYEVEKYLNKYPSIKHIQLNSPGGSIQEGYTLNKLITKRRLNTFIRRECSSACVLAYMGGEIRFFDKNAKIGFHSSFNIFGDLKTNEDSDSIDIFLNRGVSRDFIFNKIYGTKSSNLYYPTLEELANNNIIDIAHTKKYTNYIPYDSKKHNWVKEIIDWANTNQIPTYKYQEPYGFVGIPRKAETILNLQSLNLQNCNLESLPNEIANLSRLKVLKLRKNNFTLIPNTIFKLNQLRSLELSENLITSIPSEIERLKNLEELNINFNYIEKVSNKINNLPELTFVDLQANLINNSIFNTLKNNKSIKSLNLAGNNILSLDIKNLNSMQKLNELFLQDTYIQQKPNSLNSKVYLDKDIYLKEKHYKNIEDFYYKTRLFYTYDMKMKQKGIEWHRLCADYGSPKCQFDYALEIIDYDKPNSKNTHTALKYLEKAALQNYKFEITNSQETIARLYRRFKKYNESIKWYKIAIKNNNDTEYVTTGGLYLSLGSLYKEINEFEKAFSCFEKAKELGEKTAYNSFAELYKSKQNYKKSIEYYKKGIEIGDTYSAYGLGEMYEQGMGVKQNYKKAYEFYKKSITYKSFIYDQESVEKILKLNSFNKFDSEIKEDMQLLLTKLRKTYTDEYDIADFNSLLSKYL